MTEASFGVPARERNHAPVVIPFEFESKSVRIIDRSGEVEFVASDVAKILGYDHTLYLTRLMDDDEKGVQIVDTPGGAQEVATITEPGLYRAIAQRRVSASLPAPIVDAISRSQRWVFHEVLPSVRKTGGYSLPAVAAAPRPTLTGDVAAAFKNFASIRKLIGLDRIQAAITAKRATIQFTGVDALAAVGTTHLIAPQQEQLLTPTQIGQELGGQSARAINAMLALQGYQTQHAYGWEPTTQGAPWAVMQDTGKRHGDGTPVRQLKWSAGILGELREPEARA